MNERNQDYVELPVHGGYKTKVDPDIAELLSGKKLYATLKLRNYYVFYKYKNGNAYISRIAVNAGPKDIVDHISGDTFDNRRSNLRICSQSINMLNLHTCCKSKSGFRGVDKNKRKSPYHARLKFQRKRYSFGCYTNSVIAAFFRDISLLSIVNINCGLNFSESLSSVSIKSFLEKTKGRFFRCWFVKRSDGSIRSILCRSGVHKYLKNKGLAYNPSEKNLMLVYDMNVRNYRFIPLENILCLKFKNVRFKVQRIRLSIAS